MTPSHLSETPKKRRRFSPEFKARIIQACQQPGASVAAIALEHQLNANLVHKWIRKAHSTAGLTETVPDFVPLPVSPMISSPSDHKSAEDKIRFEIPHHQGRITVEWPLSDAETCRSLLRELLR